MERILRPGEIYQHFKGNLYRIVTLAEHTESGEKLVIYQALYGDFQVYARPLQMFLSEVDREKYPQVQAKYRFTLLPLVEVPAVDAAAVTCGMKETDGAKTVPDGMKTVPASAAAAEGAQRTEPAASSAAGNDVQSAAESEEEFALDPMLLAFLDADSYQRRLEIFDALHGRIDQSMLNTIAISMDLELSEGDLEEQYLALRNCMLTLEKYECNRLR